MPGASVRRFGNGANVFRFVGHRTKSLQCFEDGSSAVVFSASSAVLYAGRGEDMTTLLVFLWSTPFLWALARAEGIRYEPVKAAEQSIADECTSNLTQQDKYTVSLIRYSIGAVTIVETDAPNTDPYVEDCSTVSISSNSSNDSSIRRIVRLDSQNTSHDVLFVVAGSDDPVVCGYDPIFAGPSIDYQPRTEHEEEIETRCKQFLPHPHGYRPTLVKYESNPKGAFPGYNQWNVTYPNSEDSFREDCSLLSDSSAAPPEPPAETRPVIFITQSCHDVLFFENGTNPVVCLYVHTFEVVYGGQGDVYKPTTPPEQKFDTECKKNLVDRYTVSLRKYTLSNDNQRASIHKTDTPNSNTFAEDCTSVGIRNFTSGAFRDILYLVNGTDVTCHDVLFLYNGTDPVVCYYEAKVAGPMINYEPRTDEERGIERQCKQNLPHPSNTFVALVEYESNPEQAFPGYNQWEVTYPDTVDSYRENCTILYAFLTEGPDQFVNETRPVILISESDTCHDVLFFTNETNPVVCLFIINPEVVFEVHKDASIIVLFFTSLSIVASIVLLVTHLIFPSLQTNPSRVIMNLSTAFLLGDIFYIVQTSLTLDDPSQSSVIDPIVIVAYYFFYARFVWMALAGFEMCRTIHVGTQLRFNSASKRLKILIIYMVTGWSLPLVPTIIMAVVHFEELEKEDPGKPSLFGIGGLLVVLVPVIIILFFNVGIVVYLSYILHKAHQWQIKVTDAIKSHRRKTNFSRIFVIILTLLGVTWILFFLIYIDGINQSDAVQITTAVLNSLQPIVVSIAFLGTKKIFRKYKNLVSTKKDEEPSDISVLQNRFRRSNRRLMSFLFTDKELAEAVSKHSHRPHRFGWRSRTNSELSATSFSMFSRDSSQSLVSSPPALNGISTPPKEPPSLAPICEEAEEPEAQDSPSHVTVDLQDSNL